MVTVIVIAGTLYAPDAPVGRLLTRLVYWAICSVCQVRAVGSSISADLTWIPAHILRTPAGYNEAWAPWAFGSICPLCHLLGPNRSEPLSISADLAWIPALLHTYSVTHYVPAGYNEASGSFCPLGDLLGLPGTRPPSISADLTWIPAHILDDPLRALWIQRGFWLVLSTGPSAWAAGYESNEIAIHQC